MLFVRAGLIILMSLLLQQCEMPPPMSQFARPDADIVDNGWFGSPLLQPLFERINEVEVDILDSIRRNLAAPNSDTCTIGLSDVVDPVVHTGHIMRTEVYHDTNAQIEIRLRQGATLIATFANIPDLVVASYTLTEAEAALITDYTDLRIEVFGIVNSGTREMIVYWFELEVPSPVSASKAKAKRIRMGMVGHGQRGPS